MVTVVTADAVSPGGWHSDSHWQLSSARPRGANFSSVPVDRTPGRVWSLFLWGQGQKRSGGKKNQKARDPRILAIGLIILKASPEVTEDKLLSPVTCSFVGAPWCLPPLDSC